MSASAQLIGMLKQQEGEKRAENETKKGGWTPPPIWLDPRPDLKEDHEAWSKLLRMACLMDPPEVGVPLCGLLNGLRCGGTRLKKNSKAKWILRPDIDPTGRTAWSSREEYEEIREKYVVPEGERIAKLLEQLG